MPTLLFNYIFWLSDISNLFHILSYLWHPCEEVSIFLLIKDGKCEELKLIANDEILVKLLENQLNDPLASPNFRRDARNLPGFFVRQPDLGLKLCRGNFINLRIYGSKLSVVCHRHHAVQILCPWKVTLRL